MYSSLTFDLPQAVAFSRKGRLSQICIVLVYVCIYTYYIYIVVKSTYFYILHANSGNIHASTSESLVSLRAVSVGMKLLKHQSTLSPTLLGMRMPWSGDLVDMPS